MSIDLILMKKIIDLKDKGLTYKAIRVKLHIDNNKIAYALKNKDTIDSIEQKIIKKEVLAKKTKLRKQKDKREYRKAYRKRRKFILVNEYQYINRIDNLADDIKDLLNISKLNAIKYSMKVDLFTYGQIKELQPNLIKILDKHGYYTNEYKDLIYNGNHLFNGVKEITHYNERNIDYKVNRDMLVKFAIKTKDDKGYGKNMPIESIVLHLFYTKEFPLNHMTKSLINNLIKIKLLTEVK